MSPSFFPFLKWTTWGDWDILSWPPAKTIFEFPERIEWYPDAIDLRPEPQTWLTTYDGVSFGIPASIAACLAGFCPAPPVKTWPIIISFISEALIFDFSIALEIAVEPSLWAETFFKDPPKSPIAVLTADVMTTPFSLDIIFYNYILIQRIAITIKSLYYSCFLWYFYDMVP